MAHSADFCDDDHRCGCRCIMLAREVRHLPEAAREQYRAFKSRCITWPQSNSAAGVAMVNSHKVGRNDPCPCGSGKKFKKCCLNSQGLNEPSSGLRRFDPQATEVARSALEPENEAMWRYDPLVEPHPDQWLALDEQERIDLVLAYHRRAGIRLPREQSHTVIHAIVENQIADAGLPVRRIAQRLMSEGLDRHEAVHAIGSVLIGHLKSGEEHTGTTSDRNPNDDYFAELEVLTAKGWLRSG